MKGHIVFRLFALVVLLLGSLSTPATAAPLAQTPTQARSAQERALLDELARATDNQATVARHAGTGLVRFIGTTKEHAVARPRNLPAQASSSSVADAYLAQYGALFGLRSPSRELSAYRVTTMADGRQSVRFQQRYQGLPVIAGQLNVQLTKDQELLAISGETLTELNLDVIPALQADPAQASARALVAAHYGVAARDLEVATPELALYNPVLLGAPGLQTTSLVWRVEVRGQSADTPIWEYVLVDAQTGAIALNFNQIAEAKERHVCNNSNSADTDPTPSNNCTPYSYSRSEGEPPIQDPEVNNAYDYSGATYDFYHDFFGRDSLDTFGQPLISLVRYCYDTGPCPYPNAFWNGSQATYGDGFASANDVVAHELTHGVTQFSSGLLYYYQSGALNEGLSDIFGEFVDQLYSTNTAAERWQFGEVLGGFRNMQDPPLFGHPDRMNSPLYVLDPTEADRGGIHYNSGVANKSAYLMTDGDTFNGFTITGLGITKTAQIYYEAATTLLTSGSDYADFAMALRQSCANLTGSFGITAADCGEVEKVVLATEMDQMPTNAPAPEAEICRPGQTVNDVFYDPIYRPNLTWTEKSLNSSWSKWFTDFMGYTTSGLYSLFNNTNGNQVDSVVEQNSDVQIPANAYLHFRQSYDFFSTTLEHYAGGVVEYSTDGGATWQDAGRLFTANGYNGQLDNPTNVLVGRKAFVGISHGYRSSRLDLSSLAGSAVRFRFHAASDSFHSGWEHMGQQSGWYIDDVRIYTCAGTGPRSKPTGLHLADVFVKPGAAPINTLVATVSDAEQRAGSLSLAAANVPAGMTVGLINRDGRVSAKVGCACSVAPGVYPINVTITNSDTLTGTVTFNVVVTAAVQDPGFEMAHLAWRSYSSSYDGNLPIPFCSVRLCHGTPHSGSTWIRMGGRNSWTDTSSVSQTLDLGAGPASLAFYLHTFKHSLHTDTDIMEVLFDNTVVFSLTNSVTTYDGDYTLVHVDLGSVTAGQHTLEFRSRSDTATDHMLVNIDDVAVTAQPAPCAPRTLPPAVYLPLVLR